MSTNSGRGRLGDYRPQTPTLDDVKWVGEQLRRGYLRKGWSRAEAARRAGVNDRVWGRTERGQRETGEAYFPSMTSVVKMARAVDVSAATLLKRLGHDPRLAPLVASDDDSAPLSQKVEALTERVAHLAEQIDRLLDEVAELRNRPPH